ncbi:MAG: macrolide ABC transporter ATP-binding protein [Desulfobulbaceae bacterium A2]|nr:MAG: macrolide ABC transporter ATP-binding protein [Desulfobulbaceae bacterium A2]
MTNTFPEPLVAARGLTKVYRSGTVETQALRGIDLALYPGEFTAVVGPSGGGKTTLLNIIGALDSPTEGELHILGHDLRRLSRRARAELRLRELGFVFQAFNLMPVLTAQENVEFVLELQGVGQERVGRARQVLEQLGLAELAGRRPGELSGGQQQRVAVARAVASLPRLVLADEPTANLDGDNAELLLTMMRELNEKKKITFLFSTHDPRVVAHARRVLTLVDGRITGDAEGNPQAVRG